MFWISKLWEDHTMYYNIYIYIYTSYRRLFNWKQNLIQSAPSVLQQALPLLQTTVIIVITVVIMTSLSHYGKVLILAKMQRNLKEIIVSDWFHLKMFCHLSWTSTAKIIKWNYPSSHHCSYFSTILFYFNQNNWNRFWILCGFNEVEQVFSENSTESLFKWILIISFISYDVYLYRCFKYGRYQVLPLGKYLPWKFWRRWVPMFLTLISIHSII